MTLAKKYIKNTGGNVTMLAGLSMFVILGGVAAGTDIVSWQAQQNKLQDAADSAALAGTVKLGKGGNKIERYVHNQALAFTKEANDTTLPGFDSDVVIDQDAETVSVTLAVEVPRLFSSLFLSTNPTVRAKSVAKVVYGKTACLYVLDPIASSAVQTKGNALITATDCSIQINSTSASALTNGGNAIFEADDICVAGGFTGYGYTPMPTPNCPTLPDPFASLVVPTAGLCDFTGLSVNIDTALTPGTYCGGIHVSSTAIVTMASGVYIIKDGDLKVSGSGNVLGTEVVFVLEGNASVDIAGNGEVSTTPPTSGVLEGYSIAQSQTEPLGPVSKIAGDGKFSFPGIIYMPRGDLEITGKGTANTFTPSYAAIVVYQLKIAGSGQLHVTANTDSFSAGDSSTLTTSSARLVH